jgi:16S rRNA (adenine1518-N6/adenine1519-N6)-dimethyltransferase
MRRHTSLMWLGCRSLISVVPLSPSELQLSPLGPEARVLRALTAAAFGQRRKMLRSSLATMDLSTTSGSMQRRQRRKLLGKAGAVTLCDAAGIDADMRAEAVSVGGFIQLVRSFLAMHTPVQSQDDAA